jgi:hypothetical protein
MSTSKHHYLPSGSVLPNMGRSDQSDAASVFYAPALKYSSPWPWALALMTSGAMWAGLGWLIWKFT